MVDFLSAFPLRLGWLVRFGYWLELRYAPWSYDATYRMWYTLPFFVKPLALFINAVTSRKILRWVREFDADAVVSTYPMASLVLGQARQRGRLGVPVATFITDFAVHPLWTHPGVDLHLCVHQQAADAAAARSGGRATAPGPMVPERFHADLPDRHTARRALGFADEERLVLVVAGAWGIGDVSKTFDAVRASGFTPVVVCGNNEQLRRRLEARDGGQFLGWTDEMPTLMAAADVLVQNAGGLTCMEAFAAGLPVVSFEPIAGHGKDNAEQMAEAGVAAFATTAEELSPVLERAASLAGRAMIAKGRAMFAADPAAEVSALAAAHAPDEVAVRRRRRVGVRRVTAGVAALASTYAAFTLGVGAAAAHGIGVAHPPRNTGAVYLAVRLGPNDVGDARLVEALRQAHATAIVCGALAAQRPGAVRSMQAAGVEMANGGWGHRDRVHWGRARADLMRAPRAIHDATGLRTRDFVPQRRIDGFDLASARLVHERVVVPSLVVGPGDEVARLRAGEVVVIDGRGDNASEVLQSLDAVQHAVADAGLNPGSLSQMR
ncbi:MAG: glycosyl transferase group 1 [Acidimicrobiales bacterium]|nr:glycosyl transferase group 1 [Acidimicrobiales bacterium]